jgi:hypothetical protein
MGPETKNDCTGERQQQVTGLDGTRLLSVWEKSRLATLSSNSLLDRCTSLFTFTFYS